MNPETPTLWDELLATFASGDAAIEELRPQTTPREMGVVRGVGRGIAHVGGLASVRTDELLRFAGDRLGWAFNLDPHEIGVVMLDPSETIQVGQEVRRTGRVLDVPVGEELLGRVVDPVGRPLDGRGPIETPHRLPCERVAPSIMDRAPVDRPLQTGIKVIDALVPIGRGQRELLLGDRQTGKTSVAVDAMLNQMNSDMIGIYCSIGQRKTTVARVVDDFKRHGAMNDCVVVVGEAEAPPGLQFAAPYAATSIGEYFMEQGRDVLIVYDELSCHARTYRELSLLLRRPPGREAYPGDIFYIHSRLLERSTHLRDEEGGGSLTALPIVETEAQNVSAYIPTNLISITDGQIYLSPDRFQKGLLPAVDVGKSVSRVGGKTQLPAYRRVAGSLRLAYTQFEELEKFARFSSQLDADTKRTLQRGRRVREVLKQSLHDTMTVAEQLALFIAVNEGLLDAVPVSRMGDAERAIRASLPKECPELFNRAAAGETLTTEEIAVVKNAARDALLPITEAANLGKEDRSRRNRAEPSAADSR